MIHIYEQVANAIKDIEALKWIDIAPRVENHTNIYPAAYISIDEQTPLNPLGGTNGIAEAVFSVEIWLKPYGSSTVKPLSPVIEELKNNFEFIAAIRVAIMNYDSDILGGATLLSETAEKKEDGFYTVFQRWQCVTRMWDAE